jgi:hypothetical protein
MSSPDDLQSWLDKNALAELVAALSSAVDRGDKDRIAAGYADESYDDHGSFNGSARTGNSPIVASFPIERWPATTSPTTGKHAADSTTRVTTRCVGLVDKVIRAGSRPNRKGRRRMPRLLVIAEKSCTSRTPLSQAGREV